MANSQGARLAGLVMALLGAITYGITSPFGLMLSIEKLWESNRDPLLRIADMIGTILGVVGTVFLPFFLIEMWNYHLIGPAPVTAYSTFLLVWLWHRVRIEWSRTAGMDVESSTSPDRDE